MFLDDKLEDNYKYFYRRNNLLGNGTNIIYLNQVNNINNTNTIIMNINKFKKIYKSYKFKKK